MTRPINLSFHGVAEIKVSSARHASSIGRDDFCLTTLTLLDDAGTETVLKAYAPQSKDQIKVTMESGNV